MNISRVFFIFGFIFISHVFYGQNKKTKDSVNYLIEESKNQNAETESRLRYAKRASNIAAKSKNDSLLLSANRNLAVMLFATDNYDAYVKQNKENIDLALKIKDSSAITVASENLGSYYRFFQQNDSSFYYLNLAMKYFSKEDRSYPKARVLLYMADIQEEERDFTGSESSAIRSFEILKNQEITENILENLWTVNNLLAINSRELRNFEKAIEYNNKAIAYAKRMDNGTLNEVFSRNNIAFVYRQLGEYETALEIYRELIEQRETYQEEDPSFYPLLLDNIADLKLESGSTDFKEIEKNLRSAYQISVGLEDDFTKMNVATDLAKYFIKVNEKDSAYIYADEAYRIGKSVSANEVVLESLKSLSEIVDGNEGKKYLNEHIRLTDSLLQVERNGRNKFARIELETDQLEAENEEISKRNFYLLLLSAVLLLTAILVYIIITQRAKNKELKLVQEQQLANEEIYNLMLNQQDKVEEARSQEKIRVSKELHDGVLGRLFGTRLSLDSLNFTEGKEAIKSRAAYIGQLKTIEEDIRKISHELNADFVSGSGFMDIVSELIETQSSAYNLKHSFHYTDDINWDVISNKIKINLYRILQESMQNIYKHAEAKAIDISILLKNDVIWVNIIDDGKGFDTDRGRKGIGLKNMNSRIKEIEGSIEFLSESNKGTTVHVKLPYNSQE